MTVNIDLSVQSNSNFNVGLSTTSNNPKLGLESLIVTKTKSQKDYNYEDLINKPSIQGHELSGDSTLPEIGVEEISAAYAAALFS